MKGETTKLSTVAIEIAGRNWLTSQLLTKGFEVATPAVDQGIDLIVFREVGEAGIRALPLQLKCGSAESFSLDRKYAGRGIPMAYVWNVLDQPTAYFLTYDEALSVLGEQAASTASWNEKGYYASTRISSALRARLEPFRSRWDWIAAQLEAQPTSGSK
ncbi:MAG: hypothetical protein U1C74_09150 [Phenylobacterium sp.]|nr:hypothetical protein [Phenylobacterium sp.]